MNDRERKLELVEIAAWTDMFRAANDLNPIPGGVKAIVDDSRVVSMVPDCDVLALNRVVGLGVDSPPTPEELAEIIDHYREAGAARFFVQVAPFVINSEITRLLHEAGFEHYNNWVKLSRPLEPLEIEGCDLRVEKIGPEHAEAFAGIICSSFDWPSFLEAWVGGIVGRENWHCYLAFDGDHPAATAAFFRAGDSIWIDCAATLEAYRGRGAQSKLLQRRFEDALALGCTDVVVETAQQRADHDAPSYRNMIRYGFREAYTRPNFIYRF